MLEKVRGVPWAELDTMLTQRAKASEPGTATGGTRGGAGARGCTCASKPAPSKWRECLSGEDERAAAASAETVLRGNCRGLYAKLWPPTTIID